MTEPARRLVLLVLPVSLLLSLLWKSHGAPWKEEPVAFLRLTSSGTVIRLKGAVPSSGIYKFSDGVDVATVIRMTMPENSLRFTEADLFNSRLNSGEILEVIEKASQPAEITLCKMKAKELMILGLPLHPDKLDFEDWQDLPGIGHGLAKRIMEDRHKNGDFGQIHALLRVDGIGEGKVKAIINYFPKP